MAGVVPTEGTVAQRIRKVRHTLAPGELRVAEALTDAYPTAGLVPIAQLAAEAAVSAPTALRLVGKLGFGGYGAFQDALRAEVQTQYSPVAVYPEPGSDAGGNGHPDESPLATAAAGYSDGLRATFKGIAPDELERAVAALADGSRSVMVVGGRFTEVLAIQLFQYLRILRPGVTLVPASSAGHMTSMIDVDANTVAVVFDYRRYQQTTIEWGIGAIERGAEVILATDVYLSPLASRAQLVLPTSHAGLGPFDSLAHGFVLTELLVAMVAKELGAPARDRLAAFEDLHLAEEARRRRAGR
ncbi:MurR/RpiR family transcriptional regulator [Gordonia sp. NPDC003376]